IASRLRAKDRPARTVTVRVRFADLSAVTRAITLPAPIAATTALTEIAVELVRGVLRDHPDEKTMSLLAIPAAHLGRLPLPLELPLRLADDGLRPGTRKGLALSRADRAMDAIRNRFGWGAIGYATTASGTTRSVPDDFRSLAEKEL